MSIDDREATLRATESVAIHWHECSIDIDSGADRFIWNEVVTGPNPAIYEAVRRPVQKVIKAAVQAAWEASGA